MKNQEELLILGANSLKKAAMNTQAKEYLMNSPVLFKTLKKAAERYIGGATLDETILKVLNANTNGFKCSIEYMGENTNTEAKAKAATNEFINIIKNIHKNNINSTVSLDLSHIGLSISKEFALENLSKICSLAKDIEVTISAEGVDKTDAVIDTYTNVSKDFSNLSITMQAYLYRSKEDFKELVKHNGRIRIVKGAFDTPKGLSIPRGEALNETYLEYIDYLLKNKHSCAIATHDLLIQEQAKKMIDLYNVSCAKYEFESLYGIKNDLLNDLKNEGYMTKLYFVYGEEWYLYLCNRIAENPMSIFIALADITKTD